MLETGKVRWFLLRLVEIDGSDQNDDAAYTCYEKEIEEDTSG